MSWGKPATPAASASSWGAPAPQPPAQSPAQPSAFPLDTLPMPGTALPENASPHTRELFNQYKGDTSKILEAWRNSNEAMAIAKKREMNLRIAVFEIFFPNAKNGTTNFPLTTGENLKLELKLNYNLANNFPANERNKVIENTIDLIEGCGNEGKLLADRLFKWSAELSVTEYKKLDVESANHRQIKAAVDGILTTKPATPTLEIVVPKK